jgi:hypothetical protein
MQPGIFVFWVLCSIACYTEAGRFAARYGRTPFGWSRGMWAVLGFLLSLIAICLLGIAERVGRKQAAGQPGGVWQAAGGQPQHYGQPGLRPTRLRASGVRAAGVRAAGVRAAASGIPVSASSGLGRPATSAASAPGAARIAVSDARRSLEMASVAVDG